MKQSGYEYGVRHFLASKTNELNAEIAKQLSVKDTEADELIRFGAVYVNELRIFSASSSISVKSDDVIRVHTTPRRFYTDHLNFEELRKQIVYENESFLVVNKPSGIPVHPTVDNLHENLLALLNLHLKLDLKITQRLDIPTNGLIVYAKTTKFQSWFNRQLAERKVTKIYRAIVSGNEISPGDYRHYMMPSPRAPKTVSNDHKEGWLICDLRVLKSRQLNSHKSDKTINEFNIENLTSQLNLVDCPTLPSIFTELEIELLTGRTHQIRAQLSAMGAPIVGDTDYSGLNILKNQRSIALTCCSLAFDPNFRFTI